jgi:hypothetical protein
MISDRWLKLLIFIVLVLACLDLCLSLSKAEVTIDKTIHIGGNGSLYSSTRLDTQVGKTGNTINGRGEQYLEDESAMTPDWSTDNTTYSLSSDSPWFHNTFAAYASTTNRDYSRYLSAHGSKTFRVASNLQTNDSALHTNIEAAADAGQLTDVAVDATKRHPIELSRTVATGPFEIGIKFDAFVPYVSTDWLAFCGTSWLESGAAWRANSSLQNVTTSKPLLQLSTL